MPNLELIDNGFVNAVKSNPRIAYSDVGVQHDNFEFIRSGSTSIVIAVPQLPDHVVAFSELELLSEEAKIQFYLQRVMSTLFPHNFPHFSFASGGAGLTDAITKPDQEIERFGGTVRERIYESESAEVKFPLSEVDRVCRELGIPIKRRDKGLYNEYVGADGGEYYLDNLNFMAYEFQELEGVRHTWDIEKIIQYMKRNGHSDVDQQTVLTSIARTTKLVGDLNRKGLVLDKEIDIWLTPEEIEKIK